MKEKILIIGKIPPPVGGVSIFVKRSYDTLIDNNVDAILFPRGVFNNISVIVFLLLNRFDHIKLNTLSFSVIFLLFMTRNLRKTEVIDHNHSRRLNNSLKGSLIYWMLSKVKVISLVDSHLLSNYPSTTEYKFQVINPFIKPSKTELKQAKLTQPQYITDFLQKFSRTFVVSAWRIVLEDSVELYGIERTCRLFEKIISTHSDVGLIVCIGDPNYNTELLDRIKRMYSSSEHIIFWEGCVNSWTVFSTNTIYLRPTSTDGNSISIHEAMFFGSKIIASDVVARPDKTIVFDYDDDLDYSEKIKSECK